MNEAEILRMARISGIRGSKLPSLEQVEHRRFELWLMSTVLLLGLTGGLVLLTLWSSEEMHKLLVRPVVRFGVVGLAIAFSAYLVEKERSLRRVSALLFDERLLTTALSNRLHEISALLDAGRAVNSTLELDRVLSLILVGATDLMPATSGSVMLLEGDMLVVAAAAGDSTALGHRAAVGDGIAGHVARTLEPLLINGRVTSSVFPGMADRANEVRSALSVPLIERGELLGVLNLSAPGEGAFTEYDLRAVSLFAEQAATAIGKARLYETAQLQAQELEYAATHDSLTGLGNRAALTARADSARGKDALLFLDLDGFKAVNDSLGHAAGDEVLIVVADRIAGCVPSRHLVVRYGGDEFALLLDGVRDAETATSVAERVMCAIAEPIALHDRVVCITGSIGIALPRTTTPLSALLDEADRALYAAKAAGKARVRLSTDATRNDHVPVQRSEPLAPVGRP